MPSLRPLKNLPLFSENQYMINFVLEEHVLGAASTHSVDEVQKLFEATGKNTQQEAGEYLSQNFETDIKCIVNSLGGIDAVSSPTTVDSDGIRLKIISKSRV